jgi:hypothetical protein
VEAEPDHLPGEDLGVDGVLGAEGDKPRFHAEVESGMEDRLSPAGGSVHRLISQSEDQPQLFAKRGALFGVEREGSFERLEDRGVSALGHDLDRRGLFDYSRVEGIQSERGRSYRDHRCPELVFDGARERFVVVEFGRDRDETRILCVRGSARRDIKPMLESVRPHFVDERRIRQLACRRIELQREVAEPKVTAYVDPAAAVALVCLAGRDQSVSGRPPTLRRALRKACAARE